MNTFRKIVNGNDFKIIVTSLVYFLVANIGIWLSFPESKASPLWPPSGLALATLILMGQRTWPAIVIGSLLSYSLVFLHLGVTFDINTVVAMALIAVGNTLEGLFGYYLVVKFIKTKNPFLKASHVFSYLLIAMTMCVIGAGVSTTAMIIFQMNTTGLLTTLTTWWVSNTASVLILTPFIIAWANRFRWKISKTDIIESLILIIAFSLVIFTLSVESIAPTIEKSFPFMVIPFLLWLAYRFSLRVTTLGILVVTFAAIYFTINNQGPFVLDSETNSLLILQIFIGLVSVSTIILYATNHERTQAQLAMQDFNQKLEANVIARTKELQEEIETRQKAETKLKTTNSKLRKTNAELDNFVYRVSHDLRAPIASVLGLTNLAQNDNKVNNLKNYLEMIADCANKQDEFIQEILDISRNSRLEVQREKINFKKIMDDVFELHTLSNHEKKVIRDIQIEEQHTFASDGHRLKVILNNLVSNSIRYSNGHDPEIKVGITTDEKSAKISIQDNGVGIPKKHLNKVYKMFYRATDDNAGSGLGLYIVKETVDKLSGNIEIKSKEKQGTNVLLEIPNLLN